jgi:hypothetical protein
VPTPGTSHPETYRITVAAGQELMTIPGVRNCGSHIGRAWFGDEPYGVNFTENWISVDPSVDSFGSWRLTILSFLTLPSALVGGVLAAYLGDGIISLGSLVGFLTILGIAARNGIMMINHFQHLERHEGEVFGPALVLRGARERALADSHDHPGLRPGHRAPGGGRLDSRQRDRAPAGRRRAGGSGHLHLAQPVDRALSLPALREGAEFALATERGRPLSTPGADSWRNSVIEEREILNGSSTRQTAC